MSARSTGHRICQIAIGLAVTAALGACAVGNSAPVAFPPSRGLPAAPTNSAASRMAAAKRTPMDLQNSVLSYALAYNTGDVAGAWDSVSPRCRKVVGHSRFAAKLRTAATKHGRQTIRSYIGAITDDTHGSASYTYDNPQLDQTGQKWVKLGELWHNDTC